MVVFDEENDLTEDSLYLLTEQEAIDQFYGYYGYLTFSLDNVTLAPENNLALFLSWDGTIFEIGSNETVFFAPVIYTDIYANGNSQYELVGGFDGASTWSPYALTCAFSDFLTYVLWHQFIQRLSNRQEHF